MRILFYRLCNLLYWALEKVCVVIFGLSIPYFLGVGIQITACATALWNNGVFDAEIVMLKIFTLNLHPAASRNCDVCNAGPLNIYLLIVGVPLGFFLMCIFWKLFKSMIAAVFPGLSAYMKKESPAKEDGGAGGDDRAANY